MVTIRSIIGGIFLISAIGKLVSPRVFVTNVNQYRILPPSLAKAYGWALPFTDPRKRGGNGTGSPGPVTPTMSLEEVKEQVGVLHVPTYLPDGFELVESIAHGSEMAQLRFRSSGDRAGHTIRITQFSTTGHPMVKAGFHREIQVNGHPGYAIDGGWMAREDETGELKMRWETGRTQEVMFERETMWWLLRLTRPVLSSVSSEAELIEIAESMRAL